MSPLVKSMLLVFVASVIGSLGMAFLKMGSALLSRSLLSFVNPKLMIGIALFLGSSVFFLFSHSFGAWTTGARIILRDCLGVFQPAPGVWRKRFPPGAPAVRWISIEFSTRQAG